MMIRGSAVMLFGVGVFFFMLAKMSPLFSLMMMDWVGVMAMAGSLIILLFVFGMSGTGLLYDTIPSNSAVIPYIRRDGIIAPLLGKRIFSGESFLDVHRLGVIEDFGQGTVFLWGRKKIRFGLENINYTPDPRYWNLTRTLYRLGFDDSDDLYNVLYIPNMDSTRDRVRKTFYLEHMADIYWNLTHEPPHGGNRLVESFKHPKSKKTVFGRGRKHESSGAKIKFKDIQKEEGAEQLEASKEDKKVHEDIVKEMS